MLKHIVMWKLKGEGAVKQENIQKVKAALESCRDAVPGMLRYEIGVDVGIANDPWDLVIYSEFTDRAAQDAYQQHPQASGDQADRGGAAGEPGGGGLRGLAALAAP